MKFRWLVGSLLLLASLVGCRGMGSDWRNPGTMQTQRMRATYHDPFADEQIGPPVVGGRPRDYAHPQHEPVREPRLIDRIWSR